MTSNSGHNQALWARSVNVKDFDFVVVVVFRALEIDYRPTLHYITIISGKF